MLLTLINGAMDPKMCCKIQQHAWMAGLHTCCLSRHMIAPPNGIAALVDLERLKDMPLDFLRLLRLQWPVFLMISSVDDRKALSAYQDYLCGCLTSSCGQKEFENLICREIKNEIWEQRTMEFGQLKIDRYRRKIWWRGLPVELRGYDYEVFLILTERIGKVVPREEINQLLPERKRSSLRNVDTHIKQIRRKIGCGEMIQCVRSIGYRIPLSVLEPMAAGWNIR